MIDSNELFKICTNPSPKNVIRGSDVFMHSQSPFAFYCSHFVNDSKKDAPRDEIISLAQKGVLHEDEIIDDEKQAILRDLGITHEDQISEEYRELIPCNFKHVQIPTMREGFRMCLDEMINKKTKVLHVPPLMFLPRSILGRPDTLERREGRSVFGKHHYVVKEIKSAKIIQSHHILQAAFYNLLIGRIQERVPEMFYIVNGEKKEIPYLYRNYEECLIHNLVSILQILDKKIKPEPVYRRTPYPWSGYGDSMAIRNGGITLINGIKAGREHILRENGFKTINQIASCNVTKLGAIPKIGKLATAFQLQAKAIKYDKAIKKSAPAFPKKTTEIFLDFEGWTDSSSIYLIGALIRRGTKTKYVSFVGSRIGEEGKMWRRFLKFLQKQRDYVIYHWSSYEKTHISNMLRRHKTSRRISNSVLADNNMVDLLKITKASFAFPTYDNGLKSIAKWIGFRWSTPDVNGGNVEKLFFNYSIHPRKNRRDLQTVLDYNRDDCKATMIIKDWLVMNSQQS